MGNNQERRWLRLASFCWLTTVVKGSIVFGKGGERKFYWVACVGPWIMWGASLDMGMDHLREGSYLLGMFLILFGMWGIGSCYLMDRKNGYITALYNRMLELRAQREEAHSAAESTEGE